MVKPEQNSKPAPPTGVVTLLFTDIAGSSRLWEQYGDRFIPVWQAHDAVLRDAIHRFGGYEVKSEGDAFMVAFANPADALHCALFAQGALARYPWPADIEQPRVRMGLHTGEPFVHGNDYFGPTVNRAAHICNAAHGGQVLLSEETRRLARQLDPQIELTDLGDFRLKDMGIPQRLLQARHPSMETRPFPPPRTLEGQPNNLPLQHTSFVGRAREIEQIAGYLAEGEKAVLTITGPGGSGKTRLTLQAAAAKSEWFPDGVWYVKLNNARDAVGAAVEVASAMNIPLNPALPALPQVREWLADRRCLLILDDANTVPQANSLIRELLSGMTNLRCLATARESLQIAESDDLALSGLHTDIEHPVKGTEGEKGRRGEGDEQGLGGNPITQLPNYPTTQLPNTQDPMHALAETEAGRLFLERAFAVNPKFKLTEREAVAIAELLHKLEGIPGNIERVALMMDRLSPSAVLEWLNAKLAPEPTPAKTSPGVEKFRGILRQSAQKVRSTVEEKTRASAASLGQLLQGIANVDTDRRNEARAEELGRESLRLSQEAGNELGMAAALRQLARVKWQQGDRQSAVAMLTAAVQIYRSQSAEHYAETLRELDEAREQLGQADVPLPAVSTVDHAVALAMDDK